VSTINDSTYIALSLIARGRCFAAACELAAAAQATVARYLRPLQYPEAAEARKTPVRTLEPRARAALERRGLTPLRHADILWWAEEGRPNLGWEERRLGEINRRAWRAGLRG